MNDKYIKLHGACEHHDLGSLGVNIAKVEVQGLEAVVTALGDGEFRLRCTANNGGKNPEIISEYEFDVTGMGAATVNPYEFVSACLHNASNYELHGGFLNGVSINEFVESQIGFKGLDFGDYGSGRCSLGSFLTKHF